MSRDIGTWRHSSRRHKLKLVLCHRCHTGNFSSPPLVCYPETRGGCAVLLWRRQSPVKRKVRLLVCDTAERKIRFVAKWLVESAQLAGCFLLPPPLPTPFAFISVECAVSSSAVRGKITQSKPSLCDIANNIFYGL